MLELEVGRYLKRQVLVIVVKGFSAKVLVAVSLSPKCSTAVGAAQIQRSGMNIHRCKC
jgi:hypothetical protein